VLPASVPVGDTLNVTLLESQDDVGLNYSAEDITGAWIDPVAGMYNSAPSSYAFVNVLNNFSIPGLSGGRADIFNPSMATLFYDGVAEGIGSQSIDGIFIGNVSPPLASIRTVEAETSSAVDDATVDAAMAALAFAPSSPLTAQDVIENSFDADNGQPTDAAGFVGPLRPLITVFGPARPGDALAYNQEAVSAYFAMVQQREEAQRLAAETLAANVLLLRGLE